MSAKEKLEDLRQRLGEMRSVVVAYSGGVDSTLLLSVALEVLQERALAATAVSPSLSEREREEAVRLARKLGAEHVLLQTEEMEEPAFVANGPDRCYHCKHIRFRQLRDYADRKGYKYVVDGTNAEDVGDHRPGRKAARELGVRSPLEEAGFTKAEIRELARSRDLPNWGMPSDACLASRIPYGIPITVERLSKIGKAEELLRDLGLGQVRVRDHEGIARVELELEDLPMGIEHRETIVAGLKELGFSYVTLDLQGFRSGSMNEVLS